MCEVCSKLTVKTPERCQWRLSGVIIVNFEHISHLVLVFLLLTLNMYLLAGLCTFSLSLVSKGKCRSNCRSKCRLLGERTFARSRRNNLK